MPFYNTSNLTGDNIFEMAQAIGQLEPNYGAAMLITAFLIMMAAMLTKSSFESSILASSFVTSVVALLMFTAGIIGLNFLIISITFTAILAAYAVFQH